MKSPLSYWSKLTLVHWSVCNKYHVQISTRANSDYIRSGNIKRLNLTCTPIRNVRCSIQSLWTLHINARKKKCSYSAQSNKIPLFFFKYRMVDGKWDFGYYGQSYSLINKASYVYMYHTLYKTQNRYCNFVFVIVNAEVLV